MFMLVFFFNDTATTEIYTLSLHDALPILRVTGEVTPHHLALTDAWVAGERHPYWNAEYGVRNTESGRSEEHTSELQSRQYLVCRLLLEKKKKQHSKHS